MAPVVAGADIARPAEEVFGYVTDPSRFGEWQAGVVSGHTDGTPAVGARCVMTRKFGGALRTSTSEIIEYDPPRAWAVQGIDGPIRARVRVTIEPHPDSELSHVIVSLDFTGHGIGRLLLPMVVRQAQKEVPRSCGKLKARLEGTA